MEQSRPGGHPVRSGPSRSVRMIREVSPGSESVCGCDMKSVTVAKIHHVSISRFVTRRDDRMTMMC